MLCQSICNPFCFVGLSSSTKILGKGDGVYPKMSNPFKAICTVALCLSVSAAPIYAGSVNSYQVTGPILEVTSDMIAVKKGKDRWELSRDSSTRVDGQLKVGSKVTIQYRMVATSIQIKSNKGSQKSK